MHGTMSVRDPSGRATSTANPRPTWECRTTPGAVRPSAPSSSTYVAFNAGTAPRARTPAYPMRWVKLTLAPVVRASWLFRIWRLTSRSLAGTVRTLVAVGTDTLAAMLVAMRAAAPRRGTARSPSALPPAADGGPDGGCATGPPLGAVATAVAGAAASGAWRAA